MVTCARNGGASARGLFAPSRPRKKGNIRRGRGMLVLPRSASFDALPCAGPSVRPRAEMMGAAARCRSLPIRLLLAMARASSLIAPHLPPPGAIIGERMLGLQSSQNYPTVRAATPRQGCDRLSRLETVRGIDGFASSPGPRLLAEPLPERPRSHRPWHDTNTGHGLMRRLNSVHARDADILCALPPRDRGRNRRGWQRFARVGAGPERVASSGSKTRHKAIGGGGRKKGTWCLSIDHLGEIDHALNHRVPNLC